ncbi:hypothetical protein [Streptomyces sp. NPDC021562]|uniref:hypothetical protein n=1 Tax=Streptomyces sp. NPDC021562 TaxID=3155121 RepID=UPI0033F7B77A
MPGSPGEEDRCISCRCSDHRDPAGEYGARRSRQAAASRTASLGPPRALHIHRPRQTQARHPLRERRFRLNHFTYRHNIRKCSILDKALRDKVDHKYRNGRLEHEGVAIRTGGRPAQVDFLVIVQYTRTTTDRKYDAGRGQTIGVVNAFCKNQPNNKCPAWMNQ